MYKKLLLPLLLLAAVCTNAQQLNCNFKEPQITINFGSGRVPDLNTEDPSSYDRVMRYCPTDGHYAYVPYTGDCFRGDWLTLTEDHTPGDVDGNMMIVNASYYSGAFLRTPVIGLKGNTIYEFSVWMMNVCRPTDKCPYPLLPNITTVLQSPDGRTVAQFSSGELVRGNDLHWARYQMVFTTPPSAVPLSLTMIDNAPGGCGNDFAVDDISFRECIKIPPVVAKTTATPVRKTTTTRNPAPVKEPKAPPVVVKKEPAVPKPAPRKDTVVSRPVPKAPPVVVKTVPKKDTPAAKPIPKKEPVVVKALPKPLPRKDTTSKTVSLKKDPPIAIAKPPVVNESARTPASVPRETTPEPRRATFTLPAPPLLVKTRSNPVIRQIETPAGEIRLDLYDNGEIDGDTITIYHNNTLLVTHARLSQKPVSFTITVDADHPHHELIMVAENLGSIPPNTSLMVVTTATQRFEVFISSTEQKNAKVVIDLKE